MFICIYVNDILVTSTHQALIFSLTTKLQSEFKIKDLVSLNFFLGIQTTKKYTGLHLKQSKYIVDLLYLTKMVGAKPYNSTCSSRIKLSTNDGEPFTTTQITKYRQTVGVLLYCTLT